MGRQQGVPNWNADVAYDVISRIMPTSSTAWARALKEYQSIRKEKCERLHSDFRHFFIKSMCYSGKKWTGRSSPPANLAKYQELL